MEPEGALLEGGDGDHEKEEGAGEKGEARDVSAPEEKCGSVKEERCGEQGEAGLQAACAEDEAEDAEGDPEEAPIGTGLWRGEVAVAPEPDEEDGNEGNEAPVVLLAGPEAPGIQRPRGGGLRAIDPEVNEEEEPHERGKARGEQHGLAGFRGAPAPEAGAGFAKSDRCGWGRFLGHERDCRRDSRRGQSSRFKNVRLNGRATCGHWALL